MFSHLSMTTLILSLTLSFLFSTANAAKIYHWVDDKGRPHYSESPPREISSEELNIKATGIGSTGSATASSTSKSATKSTKTKSDEKVILTTPHSPEDRAKYCQQSRILLQQMNGNTQGRVEQPDGSYRKLEQTEIADYRAQALSGIDNYCQ